jgi:hypothetical protein
MSTVNADRYIQELNETVSISNETVLPVQEISITPETTTFFAKFSTVVTFLRTTFLSRIRTIEERTINWIVNSSDSMKIFVLSDDVSNSIQCTLSANLPLGFEFEIEDLFGKTITFVPPITEKIVSSSIGTNYVLSSSSLNTIRVRKITTTQWNIT